jgi:C-terminal processing protease CtpA/Prc
LSKSAVLENDVVYLRAGRVAGNLANELSAAYRALTTTNKVAGVVLDLRFVGGDDSASAQATANLFASKKIAVGSLVVLVNGETRGAAETLAGALRKAGVALIIGNPTAGEAATFKEFPLRNGEWLRIATTPVKSGNGPAIPSGGLQPDIAVTVSADDERAFWENPYTSLAQNNNSPGVATNNLLPFVDHTSEADLVLQKQHDGKTIGTSGFHTRDMDLPGPRLIRRPGGNNAGDEDSAPTRAAEPQKPVIRDPVLARAVDLIKGLAVVHQSRH